ncbi:uncharacterized protein B0H64DRAFT_62347 [Chaetomium fimeti]|uniref:Uncharacterized protein n=1 Tax=Chaetomium fimeti TaxID=1854472 RepID=A0AAE0H5G4_9PEZI|nr:hypothetical protein B0H64DRAFT_62347 [Chaetomium fimeti]
MTRQSTTQAQGRKSLPCFPLKSKAQNGRNGSPLWGWPPRTPWLSPAAQLRVVKASHFESIAIARTLDPLLECRKRDQSEITRPAGSQSLQSLPSRCPSRAKLRSKAKMAQPTVQLRNACLFRKLCFAVSLAKHNM